MDTSFRSNAQGQRMHSARTNLYNGCGTAPGNLVFLLIQIVKIDIYEYGCIWTPLEVFNYDIPDPQKVCFIQSGAVKNDWEVPGGCWGDCS